MKANNTWLITVLFSLFSFTTLAQNNYIITNKNGKYGLSDSNGETLIANKYDSITSYNTNMVKVSLGAKWGYVSLEDEIIIPINYDYIDDSTSTNRLRAYQGKITVDCTETKFAGEIRDERWEAGDWFILDTKGNIIFSYPQKYHWVDPFSDGISKVYICDNNNYYSKELNRVIDEDYCAQLHFGKVGLVDTLGKILLQNKYIRANKINDKYYVLTNDNLDNGIGEFTFYDIQRRKELNDKYGWVDFLFNNKAVRVLKGAVYEENRFRGKFLLLDDTLNKLSAAYDWISTKVYQNSLLKVYNGNFEEPYIDDKACTLRFHTGKYGYIDANGKEIIACKYDGLGNISNNRIIYYKGNVDDGYLINGDIGIIDNKGNIILKHTDKYSFIDEYSDSLARFGHNDGFGYLNMAGKEVYVMEKKYKSISSFSDGLAKVSLMNEDSEHNAQYPDQMKHGFINKNFTEVIPCEYDYVEDFSKGMALVFKGEVVEMKYEKPELKGKFEFINKKGENIFPFEFDYIINYSEEIAFAFKGNFDEFRQNLGGKRYVIVKETMQLIECNWRNDISIEVDGKKYWFRKDGNAYRIKAYMESFSDFNPDKYEVLPIVELFKNYE